MFQTFEDQGGPKLGRRNLPKLRREIAKAQLDGFLVPHEDEYQNEYVPEAYDRLAWVSGFTGSAGAAIVLADRAAIFVDGRYRLQVAGQVDQSLFAIEDLEDDGLSSWLEAHAPKGGRIGYDPRLHAPERLSKLQAAAGRGGARLVPVERNLVDLAWGEERPPAPAAPATPHPEEFAGETSASKRGRIAAAIAAEGADALIVTSPASLAWLFNIRGGDVKATPLALGAAILNADAGGALFLAPEKVTPELRAWLGNSVQIQPPEAIEPALAALSGRTAMLDPASASAWWLDRLEAAGAKIVKAPDPIALPRACKNAVEIEGARSAHLRDGVALTRFLHWLATEAQSGKVDEITAVKTLEAFRVEAGVKDVSFETISGAGPNGAIVHYRVTRATNRKLRRGSLFLVDSGGQYVDGTTDVTRTVAIGRPTREMRDRFTRVLKGHIALARVRFPPGTTGSALDALARMALWEVGLDYDHGTGHGVGSYLGVHEGPQRISKLPNTTALMPGMIVSNEPGYYRTGAYGIRIENLQVVTPPAPIPGGEREMLGFETLTLAPIDRALILKASLSGAERAWLDAYHARVRDLIGPRLDAEARAWLEAVTAPL